MRIIKELEKAIEYSYLRGICKAICAIIRTMGRTEDTDRLFKFEVGSIEDAITADVPEYDLKVLREHYNPSNNSSSSQLNKLKELCGSIMKKISVKISPIYRGSASVDDLSTLYNELENFCRELSEMGLYPSSEQSPWISVEDRPLITVVEGGWDYDQEFGEFLAAVPFNDKNHPGKSFWWIGLCVVGDDENDPAGWSIQDVTHYWPLPAPPESLTK
jgi:hypothetical protein